LRASPVGNAGGGVFGGTIPRSRDGVHATGRIRETSGLSKRVFYHLFAGFDRRVRGRARRVRGFGRWDRFHPRPHGTGVRSSVRWTSFVRSVVATRTRDVRRDDPITSMTMDLVSIPFALVAFRRRCSSRARDRVPVDRSVATPTWTHSTTRDTHGRTRARDKPAANRDSDVWDRFGGSQFENVPPLL
jgi:hypothetical protein